MKKKRSLIKSSYKIKKKFYLIKPKKKALLNQTKI